MNESLFNDLFMPEETRNAFRELITFRENSEKRGISDIANNLTVEITEDTDVRSIAKALGKALDKVNLACNKVIYSDRGNLGEFENILYADSDTAIFVLTNCADTLFANISHIEDIFRTTPRTTKVICLPKADCEKLKTEYEGFYYRAIGHQERNHATSEMSAEAISDFTLNQIKNEYGFDYTENFENELKRYVTTVLPRADLKGRAFAEDLRNRVLRHILSVENAQTLTVDFIPYYTKRGDLSEEKPEKNISSPLNDSSPVEKKEEIPEHTADNVFTDNYTVCLSGEEKNDAINVLLLPLSTLGRMQKNFFSVKNSDKIFPGIYQLDPVPKMLSHTLAENGYYLDKILMLETTATVQPANKEITDENHKVVEKFSGTAAEYFKSQMREYLRPSNDDSEIFIEIPIEDKENNDNAYANGINSAVDQIRKIKATSQGKNLNLYVDIHGGLRTTILALEAVLSLLKSEDISPIAVYSIDDSKYEIIIDSNYKMFDFVSGINEFLSFGRIDSLDRYYRANPENEPTELTGPIREIASGISCCNMDVFDEGIKHLSDYFSKSSEEQSHDRYLEIFIDTIKNDYGKLISQNVTIPDKIEWCLKKKFYQQAMTIIESRMPEYLIGNEISAEGSCELFTIKKRKKAVDEWKEDPKAQKDHTRFANWVFITNNFKKLKEEKIIGDIYPSVSHFMPIHNKMRNMRNEINHTGNNPPSENDIRKSIIDYLQEVSKLFSTTTVFEKNKDKVYEFTISKIRDDKKAKIVQGTIKAVPNVTAVLTKNCSQNVISNGAKAGDKLHVRYLNTSNNSLYFTTIDSTPENDSEKQ